MILKTALKTSRKAPNESGAFLLIVSTAVLQANRNVSTKDELTAIVISNKKPPEFTEGFNSLSLKKSEHQSAKYNRVAEVHKIEEVLTVELGGENIRIDTQTFTAVASGNDGIEFGKNRIQNF